MGTGGSARAVSKSFRPTPPSLEGGVQVSTPRTYYPMSASPDYKTLLVGLLNLTDRESSNGSFRVTLDYDNKQDGARVLDGDGNILGSCYDLNPWGGAVMPEAVPNLQFLEAIREAIHNVKEGKV